jgi:hypothetical protein
MALNNEIKKPSDVNRDGGEIKKPSDVNREGEEINKPSDAELEGKKIKKPYDVDWEGVDKTRSVYAENRQKMQKALATLKTCFSTTMIFTAPAAFFITLYTLNRLFNYTVTGAITSQFGSEVFGRHSVAERINALPFDLIIYLITVLVMTFVAKVTERINIYKALRFVYIAGAVVCLLGIPMKLHPIDGGIIWFVYSCLGIWSIKLILQAYDDIDSLRDQKGFPQFIDYFDESHGIKHTSIKYLDYKKKMEEKLQTEKKIAEQVKQNLESEPYEEEFLPGIIGDIVLPEIDDGIEYTNILTQRSGEGDYTDLMSDFDIKK